MNQLKNMKRRLAFPFHSLTNFFLPVFFVFWSGRMAFSQTAIVFEEVSSPFEAVYESSIAFADIDNDYDNDLLITGRSSGSSHISRLYINNGAGLFTLDASAGLSGASSSSVAFADIDLDYDLDLLITGQNSGSPLVIISKLYSNDGNGNFTLVNGTPFSPVQYSSVAFADVDGNQLPDLLLTGDGTGSDYKAELYLNDPAGIFTEVPGAFDVGVKFSAIAFADVDADNDKDLMLTGLAFLDPSTVYVAKLFLNNGLGVFTQLQGTPFQGVAYSSIAFEDVDGDNDQDLFIAGGTSGSGKSSALYINDGTGNFSLSPHLFTPVNKASIAFEDVDGDNDADLLVTGESASLGRIAELYQNDGLGNFIMVTGLPFAGVGNGSVAFADVNGDTKPDLVITGENEGSVYVSKLYLNSSMNTSIKSIESENYMVIYPNPCSAKIQISINGPVLTKAGRITVYNAIGKLVRQENYGLLPSKVTLSEFISGIYHVVLTSDSYFTSSQVLVIN